MRNNIVPFAGPCRGPETADEMQLAKILSAVKRIADQEHVAVRVGALLDALADSDWRTMGSIEWAAREVVGRDVQ